MLKTPDKEGRPPGLVLSREGGKYWVLQIARLQAMYVRDHIYFTAPKLKDCTNSHVLAALVTYMILCDIIFNLILE